MSYICHPKRRDTEGNKQFKKIKKCQQKLDYSVMVKKEDLFSILWWRIVVLRETVVLLKEFDLTILFQTQQPSI